MSTVSHIPIAQKSDTERIHEEIWQWNKVTDAQYKHNETEHILNARFSGESKKAFSTRWQQMYG